MNWCHGDTFKLLSSQENDWLTLRDFVLFSGASHCLRVKVAYYLKIKCNCCNELFAGISDIMILISAMLLLNICTIVNVIWVTSIKLLFFFHLGTAIKVFPGINKFVFFYEWGR